MFSVLIAAFSRILPEKNRRLASAVRPFRVVWSGLQRRQLLKVLIIVSRSIRSFVHKKRPLRLKKRRAAFVVKINS